MSQLPIRTVIFDVDGTLITDDIHRDKHNHMLCRVIGRPELALSHAEWTEIGGLSDRDAYEFLVARARRQGIDTSFPNPDEYIQQANAYLHDNMDRIRIRSGARDIIKGAFDKGLLIGVATNADEDETRKKLSIAGLSHDIRFLSTLDEVQAAKPAPDLYINALSQAADVLGEKIQPSQSIAIEDTLTGATAALAAGCQTILWTRDKAPIASIPKLHVAHSAHEVIAIMNRLCSPPEKIHVIRKKIIDIISMQAGGGHDSSRDGIISGLSKEYPEYEVRVHDFGNILRSIDPIYVLTLAAAKYTKPIKRIMPGVKLAPEAPRQMHEIYNGALKGGHTSSFGVILPILQRFIRIPRFANQISVLITNHWLQMEKPDLIVSVIPNFNNALNNVFKTILPETPFVTIMTDMADHPPHFWMEDQDQTLICGTRKAYDQALATGFYAPHKVHLVSGMILKESFYPKPRALPPTFEELGLEGFSPDLPTFIIMFGGTGASVSKTIVDNLNKANLGVQMIVMFGRNQDLLDSLQGIKHCFPVGFVNNVADYMRLASGFIGKPGPGSLAEAWHMRLPVIVECNKYTMPQELPNVTLVQEYGAGIVIKSFETDEVIHAARFIIQNLAIYKSNIETNIPENRAVYEIVDILDDIITKGIKPNQRPVRNKKKTAIRTLSARVKSIVAEHRLH